MRIPESWLREMVQTDLSIERIADVLTMAGLEVEEVETAAPPFTGVRLGKILSAQKHPDADRLQVCEVSIGTGTTPLQIVCGAPNARAGLMVACATDGALLPGGFKIKQAKMRGVVSQGMLCSAKELGISEASEGILEVDANEASLGEDIRQTLSLDAATLVLKLTPNRGDCLSMLGVARELSALLGVPLSAPSWSAAAPTIPDTPSITCAPDAKNLCGRFSSRVIRGVNAQAPTPGWMKQRLEQSGQRPISALVDISNYVMLELGRPSHVFDLDALSPIDSPASLAVRWAQKGEACELLNGQAVTLDPSVGVIADAKGPVALAGIMGGARSAVSDQTQNILLEAAFWWPDAIRGRAQRFKFSTDAGHRFERGVDPSTTAEHLERITALILEVCGGQAGPVADAQWNLPIASPVNMRRSRCERLIGRPYSRAEVESVFKGLGFSFTHAVVGEDDVFTVTPPPHRFDLAIEEDLVEEVARVIGFEQIPSRPPVGPQRMSAQPETQRTAMAMRDRMVSLDFQEVVTYSFMDSAMAAQFAPPAEHLVLQNPIASQLSTMRPSIVPNLLKVLADNIAHRETRVRIFELGRVFRRDASVHGGPWSVKGVSQPMTLCALAWGGVPFSPWEGKVQPTDFFDLKQDLVRLAAPCALTTSAPAAPIAGLHPGRAAVVKLGDSVIGVMGELHPTLVAQFELPSAPVVFEVALDSLLALEMPTPQPPARHPSVSRDLAFVLPRSIAAGDVHAALMGLCKAPEAKGRLQSVVLFDQYRGPGLAEDEKSLAFRFVLQDTEKTLEDSEVDACMDWVAQAVVSAFSAKIRK